MKYVDFEVTFREIPDEITLCINISNCPFKCEGCHSKELWKDIGKELTISELSRLLSKNKGVTCISFMGGDKELDSLLNLLIYVKDSYPNVKTAWYTGRKDVPLFGFPLFFLDYIKLGPYIKERGPLDNKSTNQRLYKLEQLDKLFTGFIDITYKFWKNE